jgi:plasmid stability protein
MLSLLSKITMIAKRNFFYEVIAMPDLLVRNVDEQTKRCLAIRAAQNGRSVQAEAKAILETALAPASGSWVSLFLDRSSSVEGFTLDVPQRSKSRPFSFSAE